MGSNSSKPKTPPQVEIIKRRPEQTESPKPSFHRFSEFPDEIQAQIWRIAISAPRIVKIKYRGESNWACPSIGPLRIMTPHFIDPAWRLASQICSMSREEARRDVRRVYNIHKGSQRHCPLIFFMNIKTDILLLNGAENLRKFAETQISQRNEACFGNLKYLAIGPNNYIVVKHFWNDIHANKPYKLINCLVSAMRAFPALEEVYIIVQFDLPPSTRFLRSPTLVGRLIQIMLHQRLLEKNPEADREQKMPLITFLTREQLRKRAPGI